MIEVTLDELLRRLKVLRDKLDNAIACDGKLTSDTEEALKDVEVLVEQIHREMADIDRAKH